MRPVAEARDLALAAGAHARAAGRLLGSEKDQVKAVHLARRHIKRSRSLLRALRPLARRAVERENGFLRAFAHTLAPLRDAHALEEAARAVGARGPGAPRGERVDLAALGGALQRQARVIARLAPVDAPKHYLAKAVARAYGKARRAYRTYEAKPAEETLHDARKRIKDCLHLVEALDEVRPRGALPKAGRLDRIGELMGAIRDLDLLSRRIERTEAGRAKLARIAARHARLEKEVARSGDITFAAKPKLVEKQWRRARP
ncbi:MAG: CHAD domain-containing protein [Phreatobacter sp.]|nr:CHAD domain-containing protein [Phreatobacter sp.]